MRPKLNILKKTLELFEMRRQYKDTMPENKNKKNQDHF